MSEEIRRAALFTFRYVVTVGRTGTNYRPAEKNLPGWTRRHQIASSILRINGSGSAPPPTAPGDAPNRLRVPPRVRR
jgi:hypothetical protein